ncbi:hypothetical protein PtrM4_103440 [Pyrenophora tritici-repentis]|uniref:Uncharacterized protein n=1 Tax=Pyrenophora tritici-repentis TaxID=45151 RepID=A0A834RV76_9PLEO|nr:Vps16-C multi-domain protein [Pyrenophora tritici-repentis]KAF7570342.1 hypothetical protein PtrM4_103440 [Pyrenophora tritici-repentis]
MSKRTSIEVPILCFGRIHDVECGTNGKNDFDGARKRIGRRYYAPRYNGIGRRYSEELGARFGVRGNGNEVIVPEKRNEAGTIELAGYDAKFFCAMTECKRHEVALEIVVAADRAV